MPGTLYVVSTPIGNLEDITLRALRVLKEVDLIAAEDTRHSLHLLNHFDIHKPLTSYHDHNKHLKAPQLVHQLISGKNIALVSDAGTPGISDPGYHLIQCAIKEKVPVVPIPGVTAMITALSVSGLPTDSFLFIGFLPRKTVARKKVLETLKGLECTLVFYESPYRIQALLEDIANVLGNRTMTLARELTKKFEEILRASVSEIISNLPERAIKGEFTVIVHGNSEN